MLGRREFGVASLSAMTIAALEGTVFAQERQNASGRRADNHEMHQACAKACSDCQRACDMCATHCAQLVASGKKEHLITLATCQDCADFCVTAAQIVARGGPFAALICESCAEACAQCGKECEKYPDDEHMKKCAEECRKCEKACRDMVQHLGHGQQ